MNFETFDALYLEKLRLGDETTELHFHRYFDELITLKLRSRLQSRQAIEDVRQETFTRLFVLLRSKGGIRQAERLGALVNSICNNVLFEQYRSSGRAEQLDEEQGHQLVDSRPDALDHTISAEMAMVVRDVLKNLKGRDRILLHGVFIEDRDKDEICRELGVDRSYLRVLIHRAKESFRQQYARQTDRKRA